MSQSMEKKKDLGKDVERDFEYLPLHYKGLISSKDYLPIWWLFLKRNRLPNSLSDRPLECERTFMTLMDEEF